MSPVFVDTSALYALLVRTDERHPHARSAFTTLMAEEAALVTTSYVLVEVYALLGRRLGLDAVAAFRDELAPLPRRRLGGPGDPRRRPGPEAGPQRG